MTRPGQSRSVTRTKLLLSIKTLCLVLVANIRQREEGGDKWDNLFISTSQMYGLLLLPKPVSCRMSPLPEEFWGEGPKSCTLPTGSWACLLSRHQKGAANSHQWLHGAPWRLTLASTHVCVIYYVATSVGWWMLPELLTAFAYFIFTTGR